MLVKIESLSILEAEVTKKAENEELEEYAKANERGKFDGFVCLCVCIRWRSEDFKDRGGTKCPPLETRL